MPLHLFFLSLWLLTRHSTHVSCPRQTASTGILFNVQEVSLPKRISMLFSEQLLYPFRLYRAGRVTVTDF